MKNCLNYKEIPERRRQLKHVNTLSGCVHNILEWKEGRERWLVWRFFFYVG